MSDANYYNNSNIGSIPVSNTSTIIVARNSKRKYCALTNKGPQDVWVNIGKLPVFGEGILLGKNGGSYEIDQSKLHTGTIAGITLAGTSNVAFLEGDI